MSPGPDGAAVVGSNKVIPEIGAGQRDVAQSNSQSNIPVEDGLRGSDLPDFSPLVI